MADPKQPTKTEKAPLIDKKLRYRIELLVILLVVTVAGNIGIFYFNKWYYDKQYASGASEQKKIGISHSVKFSDNQTSTQTVDVPEGANALQVLQQLYKIEYQNKGTDTLVTSINRQKANLDKNQRWILTVNNKKDAFNPATYIVAPGDKLVWELHTEK